jgi:DNA-binding NtrC family response regulator
MKRVLVIESDQANRKHVRQRLEADGRTVSECETGEEATQLFRSGADAVMLAQNVNELSAEFWQDLRSIQPAPSIVVVPGRISGALDSSTIQNLREGSIYVAQPASEAPQHEYRLPVQGINFYDLERNVLSQALQICRGNQTRAGTLLGLSRDQIRYRMAKFGLTSSGFQDAPVAESTDTRAA